MNASRLAVLLASAALLSACASDAIGPRTPAARGELASSSYGLFLAGQGALNDGRGAEAAVYFEQARIGGDDSDGLVSERAFTAALLAGDISRAAALAPKGEAASEPGKRLGELVRGVECMAQDKPKLALPLLSADTVGFPHKSLAALLAPWAAAMAGDVDGSLVRPQVRGD
jgi:hypothetical protein